MLLNLHKPGTAFCLFGAYCCTSAALAQCVCMHYCICVCTQTDNTPDTAKLHWAFPLVALECSISLILELPIVGKGLLFFKEIYNT